MSMHFRDLAGKVAADGAITTDEVLSLRREGWSNGSILPDEAEAIFAINDALAAPSAEWSDFFVEAMGEFIVNQVEPKGYVSVAQARWLMARIDHNGRTDSLTELELLVRLFERALSVPQSLRDYALAQIEQAVLTGKGPTRDGGSLEKGNVTDGEARLMRRILFAGGSERPAGISRSEAELLYRIKDAALGASNAPEWKRLFVQGVGNYLAGFTSYEPVSRERAAELDAFMNDNRSSLGGFARRMGKSFLRDNFYDVAADAIGRKPDGADLDARSDQARAIDLTEQTWLESQIDGNGEVDEYDVALLAFLAEESGFSRDDA
jgi:hypothetical protein